MTPGTDGETTSAILLVLGSIRCEGAYHLSIDQNLQVLTIPLALSCIERDLIATCRKADRLANQARLLQEGHLRALRSIGITTSESTAVGSDACPIIEGPSTPGGTVLIIAVAQRGRLEASLGQPRISCW